MDLTQWLTVVRGQCFCHHTPPTSTQLSSHFLLSRHASNETMTQSSILWGMIMMTKQRFMHTSVWQSGLWPLLMQKDGSVIVITLSDSTAHFKHISYTVRATLPPSTLFADRALLCRGYSISEPNTWGETVSRPLGLTLGLVYNPSRLQLTRQSLHSITKREWHGWICWPWWALQVIKRQIGCRSAVWIGCSWVGREWRGVLKVLAVEQTSS